MDNKQFYYKQNRLQQLKGFYYSVLTGSISNSSKKMGLTQAAVSLQIQSLERDLGVKLFIRDKKKITLTDAGKVLYSRAAHYIQGMNDLFESFSSHIKNKKLTTLDIASNHVGISYILPKYLKCFKGDNPSAKFKIRNLSRAECFRRAINDEIDFFIYPLRADEDLAEFDFIPIVKYQPILLTRKDHPLAKKKDLKLSDVAKYELVRIDPHLITLPAFEEIIKSHGLRSSIEFEMSDWEILKKFVKADIGVAIISNIILEGEEAKDFSERVLTSYFPEMTYGIFIKKGKILPKMLRDFIAEMSSKKLLNAQNKFKSDE